MKVGRDKGRLVIKIKNLGAGVKKPVRKSNNALPASGELPPAVAPRNGDKNKEQ